MLGPKPDMQGIAFQHVDVAIGLAEQGLIGADAQVIKDGGTGELASGHWQGEGGRFVGDQIFGTKPETSPRLVSTLWAVVTSPRRKAP